MKILAWVFSCFTLFSESAIAEVSFTPLKEIRLQAQSCEELEFYAGSILAWNESITKERGKMPECYCSSKSCRMDVGEISPFRVKELINYEGGYTKNSAYNGPNCFNAALYFSSSLPNLTFTHPYEMTGVLASSLCRERRLSEELEPGDLLVVRNQNDPLFEIHAGVYINGVFSFSKYGQLSMMDYDYGLNVDKVYGVNEEACRRVQGVPVKGDFCYKKPFVNYFTCSPLYSFVSRVANSQDGVNELARNIYAKTARLDLMISALAYKGDSTHLKNLKGLQEQIRNLYSGAGPLRTNAALNSLNKELVRLMHLRLFSLYEQIRIIGKERRDTQYDQRELPQPN